MANLTNHVSRIREKSQASAKITSEIVPFPRWSPRSKALPNIFLRSNLFTARHNNQPRAYRQEEEIAVYGGGSITYTGQELRQNDEDVYLVLIDLVKRQYGFMPEDKWPHGDTFRIEFTPKDLLDSLGKTKAKKTYSALRTTLIRLQTGALTIRNAAESAGVDESSGVSLSMLPKFGWKGDGSKAGEPDYFADIPKTLFRLFASNSFTALHWEQRRQLEGGLAKWLHSFYSTHSEPYPLSLETIRPLCGLASASRNLRIKVNKALDELKDINFLVSGGVENGLIVVEKANDAERIASRKEALQA